MNSALSGRRVLVVEDEVMVSWMLEDMLTDSGYEIVGPAASVNQALAMVEAEAIDLAILDINLNGERSYPVADALIARGVPFAFSTGYNKEGMPVCYRDFPVLQKPLIMAELTLVLSKLLTPKKPHIWGYSAASVCWIVGLALTMLPAAAQVAQGDPQQGQALAQAWCSSCHMVSPQQRNAGNDAVPSFASVARMPSTTQMSLEAFLQSPHPPMPDLKLSRNQLDDVAAYILSLRKP